MIVYEVHTIHELTIKGWKATFQERNKTELQVYGLDILRASLRDMTIF
jgi:uracil phosphoribosyltransferase